MTDIIDLRTQKKGRDADEHIEESDVMPASLEWSALEYEKRTYTQRWFATMGISAALLIAFGILAQSYFFVTLIVLAFAVVVLYVRRPPGIIRFAIMPEGVQAGKAFYEFSHLKSFWMFDVDGAYELSLETDKLLHPYVRIPLGEMDAVDVDRILEQYLDKKEQEESMPDRISRFIGF